jgi:hypothetical protein
MDRITKEHLEAVVNSVNDMAKPSGKGVKLGASYGMTNLYLVDINAKDGCVLRQLTAGTKREIVEYLYAIQSTFWYLMKKD